MVDRVPGVIRLVGKRFSVGEGDVEPLECAVLIRGVVFRRTAEADGIGFTVAIQVVYDRFDDPARGVLCVGRCESPGQEEEKWKKKCAPFQGRVN